MPIPIATLVLPLRVPKLSPPVVLAFALPNTWYYTLKLFIKIFFGAFLNFLVEKLPCFTTSFSVICAF
jgi:hypothetical protein